MQIGKFKIDVLDTGLFGLDGGSMFGVVPKPLWTKAYNMPDELNRIPLASRPMLIQFDNKKILVDAGNGNKATEKFAKIYNIDLQKSDVELALSALNLQADDITHFIYTHLHFDHAGGTTKYINGNLEPVFKKAKHYVQKKHYDWAMNPRLKDRASFIPDDFMPVRNENMLEFIDGRASIFDGIELIPIDGHTQHLQMVSIKSDGKSLLFCSDLAPTAAHVKETFGMGYDNFPLTTIEEKQKYFAEAYEEKTVIVFQHDAFTQAGILGNSASGFFVEEKVTISE